MVNSQDSKIFVWSNCGKLTVKILTTVAVVVTTRHMGVTPPCGYQQLLQRNDIKQCLQIDLY